MKVEINYRKKNEKKNPTKQTPIRWRINNMLLKKPQWVNEEIKEEIRKYPGINKNENKTFQIYGMQQK